MFKSLCIGVITIIITGCSTKVESAIHDGNRLTQKICSQGYDNCLTLQKGTKEQCKNRWCR